jgi:glycosidase
VIYLVLVDRFANGDPANDGTIDLSDPVAFHGGDIRGVLDHLDDLQDLGVETLWLTPVTRMRTEPFHGHGAFHGYWTERLGEIEPRLGTESDLRALSDALQARGMKLWLDMVYNHVAPDGALLREQPSWFHPPEPIHDWSDPRQRVEGQVHGLPDLDQANPQVFNYLLGASKHWLDVAAPDAFRVDAVRHMPADFVAKLGDALRPVARPGFELVGEVFDGDPRALAHAAWSARLDRVFDFPLHYAMVDTFCKGGHPGALGAVFAQDGRFAHPERSVTFLDNHDLPRILAQCGGDPSKVATALEFLFSARGAPAITYGTESGLYGMDEVSARTDMRWAPTETAAVIARLAKERQGSPPLREGRTLDRYLDATLYVYSRATEDAAVTVAVNVGTGVRRFEGHVVPGGSVRRWASKVPVSPRQRPVRLRALDAPAVGEVRLVGAGDTLGNWDPAHGIPLPATVEMVEQVQAMKLVVVEGDVVTWSEAPNTYWLPDRASFSVSWGGGGG